MTKIKICGIKDIATTVVLNALQPEYVGLVLAKSSRQVDFLQAVRLRHSLNTRIQTVAVLTTFEPALIRSLAESQVIQAVQLHLALTADQLTWLHRLGLKVFQVIQPQWSRHSAAEYWLFDAPQPGSGRLADWQKINNQGHPFILAGGLNPKNVATAITMVNPDMVDVSSGVETNGEKDVKKISEFIRRVRNANKTN
ncbi:phosphoribosylanthranilate isomerase [Liquorilactobacillus sicerae]|uniref:phosphoribosylanthranilate isomerase n=1 Tax=Liquorilactobacillus sicerae TaxID=1416943 RepID=UPI0024801C30|nr:phosphoribosylanthranilate isomerase [Liquorilactobacillus sicerae]